MPYKQKDDEIKRLYTAIGPLAKALGVAPSAVRFWLAELKIDIKKGRTGKRNFTEEDIKLVYRIKGLTDIGLELKAIAHELQTNKLLLTMQFLQDCTEGILDAKAMQERAEEITKIKSYGDTGK